MTVTRLYDKSEIEAYLRRDVYLHLYEIGDLDDFFWPYTAWHALKEDGQVRQVALVYTSGPLPVLLAMTDEPPGMRELLQQLLPLLPCKMHAHLSDGVVDALTERYDIPWQDTFCKMGLTRPTLLDQIDSSGVDALTTDNLDEVTAFYQETNPDNWFERRMLETGYYYGLRQHGRLVSAAGVHVYSSQYRVATLGNVVTHPDYRGQGLATRVCAKLCRELLKTVDYVGLNVRADNAHAVACYRRIGFEPLAIYGEYSLVMKENVQGGL
jgi:RimJ/RimL family protein N-acetyltransferase